LRLGWLLRGCELVLNFAASMSLAVVTISGIAALLAIATWYESYYGSAAARLVIYESPLFYAVLFGLALNIAAAVIVRYPWKRKHTGFIVTHIGLEILLLGCLLDIRLSAEGRVALRPGQTADAIDSIRDGLFVSWQTNGRMRTEVVPMECWLDAGYPGFGRFLLSPALGLKTPAWPEGQAIAHPIAPGVTVELLDWAAAAKARNKIEPRAGANGAAELRLTGSTPAGVSVDERLMLHSPDEAGAAGSMFNGIIEATMHPARAPEEAAKFVEPIDVATLPPAGILNVLIGGKWFPIDVTARLGKETPLGDSGWSANVEGYFPAARWDGKKLSSDGDTPTDPMVKLRISRSAPAKFEPVELVVSARLASLTGPIAAVPANFGPVPAVLYDHPAVLKTNPAGTRGRLELLQCADGKLLYRRCGLRGVEASGELVRGTPMSAWMGLSLELSQYEPAGDVVAGFVQADVAAKDLADGMRAARVALTVDGERKEFTLFRGGSAQTIPTKRGGVIVHYGFETIDLPASLTLKSARQGKDPGTDRPATYESDVEVRTADGEPETTKITMNEPLTVAGRTFYQAGFDESAPNGPISVLSMRYDPGRPVKYAGCLFIVSGIFLMFYMRSYFQKPAGARAVVGETVDKASASQSSVRPDRPLVEVRI
jgi:hypothetical protein